MGTEIYTLAALDADINTTVLILENSFHRAGRNAVTAMDAELFTKDQAAAFTWA